MGVRQAKELIVLIAPGILGILGADMGSAIIIRTKIQFHSLNQRERRLAEDYRSGQSLATLNELIEEKEENGTTNFHLLRMNS